MTKGNLPMTAGLPKAHHCIGTEGAWETGNIWGNIFETTARNGLGKTAEHLTI